MADAEQSAKAEAQLRAEADLTESLSRLLSSDLQVANEDYKLLTRLNQAATKKYEDMESVVSSRRELRLSSLNKRCHFADQVAVAVR
jgi:uncharacterized protein YfbU (UPF0304 family)